MNIHSPTGITSPGALSPTGQKMVFNIDTQTQQNMLKNAMMNFKDPNSMETD